MSEIKEDKWINIDEIAEYFGVKVALWLDYKDKDFLAQKIGKAWKFKYSELEVWIKKQNKD